MWWRNDITFWMLPVYLQKGKICYKWPLFFGKSEVKIETVLRTANFTTCSFLDSNHLEMNVTNTQLLSDKTKAQPWWDLQSHFLMLPINWWQHPEFFNCVFDAKAQWKRHPLHRLRSMTRKQQSGIEPYKVRNSPARWRAWWQQIVVYSQSVRRIWDSNH